MNGLSRWLSIRGVCRHSRLGLGFDSPRLRYVLHVDVSCSSFPFSELTGILKASKRSLPETTPNDNMPADGKKLRHAVYGLPEGR